MGHAYPMRFHGVPLSVVVITNVTCIERQRQLDECGYKKAGSSFVSKNTIFRASC